MAGSEQTDAAERMEKVPIVCLVAVLLAVAAVLFLRHCGSRRLARGVSLLLLLIVLLFCIYGFAATAEPMDRSVRMTWRSIYIALGILCVAGAGRLLRPNRSRR